MEPTEAKREMEGRGARVGEGGDKSKEDPGGGHSLLGPAGA